MVSAMAGTFFILFSFPAKLYLSALIGMEEVVCCVSCPATTSQRSFPAIWREKKNQQKNFLPPKTQPFN
jgi:hypothetical protein